MKKKAVITEPRKASGLIKQGVGESKRFNAPDPADQIDPYRHIRECHMGGRPVEEVIPIEAAHLITYEHTDEGIEARNEGKTAGAARVRSNLGDRAPVRGLDRDRVLQERRDFKHESLEPWEAPDPMKELVEKHIQPGMRPRFLSPFQVKKFGNRGFEPVKDESGNPVKLGELVLAQMPEEKAEQRNRVYREKDRQRVREVNSRNEKHARVDSAEAFRPIVREVAEPQGDGLHSDWAE